MHVHTRQFPVSLAVDADEADGRTLIGRIVPYGEVISFVDPYDGRVKRERFEAGAFARQSSPSAWARVLLAFQHDKGFHSTIGYGKAIVDRPDGAWASFRLYASDAPKVREMVTTSHRGLSVEFVHHGREVRDPDGVIMRRDVRAQRVGITPDPAYLGAQVLAVREHDPQLCDCAHDDQDAPAPPTPNLDQVVADLARRRGEHARR